MRLLDSIHDLDLVTFSWCLRRKRRDLMISISRTVSRSADGPLYAVIALILAIFEYSHLVLIMAIGVVLERCSYFFLKKYFRRNRPPEAIPGFQSVIQPSDQFSFPSGHTSAAFLIAVLLTSSFPPLAWLLFPWAVTVASARVLLGVHFPTDTVAGAILGSSIGLLTLNLLS